MPFVPGPYSGVSTLALAARVSALGVGVVYGSLKLGILKELKETRAMNIAQAEKPGDFVLHTLEYGWRNGVRLIPQFINRDALELAQSEPAPKVAQAPGVSSVNL